MRSTDPRSGTLARTTGKSDLARMRACLAAEMTFEEIAESTGWDYSKIRELQATIFAEEERSIIGRRREETFVDYVIRSRAHIAQLDAIALELTKSNQGSAAVGAILGKQKILDSIIARGQELGFVDKKPERRETAIVLARLDDQALAERAAQELAGIRGLMAAYGQGVKFLDVDAVPVAPSAPPIAAPRAAPAPSEFRAEPPPTRAPDRTAPAPAAPAGPERRPSGAAGLVRRKAIPTGALARPIAVPGR